MCFNSSVGILSIGTLLVTPIGFLLNLSFNSSVGILSIGTNLAGARPLHTAKFQFLGRNSVHWDLATIAEGLSKFALSFNSSVVILSIGTPFDNSAISTVLNC